MPLFSSRSAVAAPNRRLALLRLFSLALAGPALAESPAAPQLQQAWARATPGPAKIGAAYLTVTTNVPDRLLAAEAPIAGRVELHSMVMESQVMKMRPMGGIDVEPGKPLVLVPGGFHLMLLDLKHPLKVDEKFPLTLTFEKAGKVETTVTVERAGAMGPGGASPGTTKVPMGAPKM